MRGFFLTTTFLTAMSFSPAHADPLSVAIATTAIGGNLSMTVFGASFSFNFLGSVAVRAALGYALNALAPKPASRDVARYTSVNTVSPAAPRQVILGETRVGGVVFYQATTT